MRCWILVRGQRSCLLRYWPDSINGKLVAALSCWLRQCLEHKGAADHQDQVKKTYFKLLVTMTRLGSIISLRTENGFCRLAVAELNVTTFTVSLIRSVSKSSDVMFTDKLKVSLFCCPVSRRITKSFTTAVAKIYHGRLRGSYLMQPLSGSATCWESGFSTSFPEKKWPLRDCMNSNSYMYICIRYLQVHVRLPMAPLSSKLFQRKLYSNGSD